MPKFEIDFLPDYSKQSLLEELRRLAKQLGKRSLSRRDIDEHGRMSSTVVLKRFGSLRQALQAADLAPVRFMKATNEELLDLLEEAWVLSLERHGRRPERSDLRAFGSPVSADTIVRRFGSWKNALVAVANRANPDRADVQRASLPLHSPRPTVQRRAIPVSKRFFVLKRDRYRCRLCKAAGVPLEVDHVIPVARGGSDALDNLQALCFDCNRGKRGQFE